MEAIRTNPYALDKLMQETRVLAAEYYRLMGQTLPVSLDLARFDAARLLQLNPPQQDLPGVDFLDGHHPAARRIQIKARVLFDKPGQSPKLGQIKSEGLWDCVILVLYQPSYELEAIYQCERQILVPHLNLTDPNPKKRGVVSVAKFKALSDCLWPLAHTP